MSCIIHAIRSVTGDYAIPQTNIPLQETPPSTAWKVARAALGVFSVVAALTSGVALIATGSPIALLSTAIFSITTCCIFSAMSSRNTYPVFNAYNGPQYFRPQQPITPTFHAVPPMHIARPRHYARAIPLVRHDQRVEVGNRGQVPQQQPMDPEGRVGVGDGSTL